MSGTVFDEGSIISVTPVEGWELVVPGEDPAWPVIGWGVIVLRRDGWSVDTEVHPLVACCGSIHSSVVHVDSHTSVSSERWELRKLTRGE